MKISARVAFYEVSHSCDAVLDCFIRGGVTESNVLAFVGHAWTKMDIGEYRDTGFVQQPSAKFIRILRLNHAARFGDVRPGIERTAG